MEVKKHINQGTLIYGGILMLACLLIAFSQPIYHSSAQTEQNSNLSSQFFLHKATKLNIDNNGQKIEHISRASTVGAALAEIDLSLPSGTISVPERNTILNGQPTNVNVYNSIIPVKIVDQNRTYLIQSRVATVGEILASCNIHLNSHDKVYPGLEKKISAAGKIIIDRALPVTVTFGDQTYQLQTQAKNQAELLAQAKEELNITEDLLEKNPEQVIHAGDEISLSTTHIEEISEQQNISPETIYTDDYDLPLGEERIINEGQTGSKTIIFRITFENDQEIGREVISEQINQEPISRQIARGQKQPENIPVPTPTGPGQVGTASWYYYGNTPSCANRDYPSGTNLLVTNTATGASVVVIVNDYGPAAWTGRIIDLNSVAFSAIAPLGQGLVEVSVSPI